ncbi:MAG: ATP-binding protein [Clostridiales bacterium]|nr:ATP-binding protein [Clostridiales bacterium]
MSFLSELIKLVYQVDGDDFTAAGSASSDVKRIMKQLGMDSEITRRVTICMYEGEMNMVIHAKGGEAFVEIDDEKVKILMKDKGPGIPDLNLAMQEGWTTADETARNLGFGAGMGLPNMKRYSDEFQIETKMGEGTTVTMQIWLNGGKKVA